MFTGTAVAQSPSNPVPMADAPNISQLVPPTPQKPSEDIELTQIHDHYQTLNEACFKTGGTMNGVTCEPPPPPPMTNSPESPQTQGVTEGIASGTDEPQGVLIGQLGWSTPWGNCVDEPGVDNPGWGNPIDWPITTTVPRIGESALFYFNHVAVVVGIWSNGDIEVGQENSPGAPHTYSPNQIRGYR